MLLPVILEKPTQKAVSLEEAKKHLDVFGFEDDDIQIIGIVDAAINHLEETLNIKICKAKYRQDFANFEQAKKLAIYPVLNIESVSYIDDNDEEKVLDNKFYDVYQTDQGTVIFFKGQMPKLNERFDAVKVTFYGGYEQNDLPPSLKAAILLHCGSLYEYREDLSEVKPVSTDAYNALIWPYRRPKT